MIFEFLYFHRKDNLQNQKCNVSRLKLTSDSDVNLAMLPCFRMIRYFEVS